MHLALAVWMAAVAPAQERPYSADIELVHPALGGMSPPGVDALRPGHAMDLRFGTQVQYQRDPLTLTHRLTGEEQGAIVANRATLVGAVALDLSEQMSVGLQLPTALSWGSEVVGLGRDGAAAGDMRLVGRWVPFRWGRDHFAVGARAALVLPTGTPEAWAGERGFRGLGALALAGGDRSLRIAGELAMLGRQELATREDLTLGTELQGRLGARLGLPAATRTAITGALHTHTGLANPLGGGETAAELLAGLQLLPGRHVTVDVAAGRGLTEGVGTTDLRLLTGIALVAPSKDRPQPVAPTRVDIGPPDLPDLPDHLLRPKKADPKTPPLAALGGGRIQIHERLEFRVGTSELLPRSLPVLAAVAGVLRDNLNVAHVVVEGHASREGTHVANYMLAEGRARAVWEHLLLIGVDPKRLSYRGFGEVEPLVEGTSEEALQTNRRVEFLVVATHDGEPPAPRAEQVVVPWTGEAIPRRGP